MDSYRATTRYGRTSRQAQILDTVSDCRFVAPAKLAQTERHEQMLAEAQLRRLRKELTPIGQPPLMGLVRQRLGSVLMLIGTSLQGIPAIAATGPATSDRGAATALK